MDMTERLKLSRDRGESDTTDGYGGCVCNCYKEKDEEVSIDKEPGATPTGGVLFVPYPYRLSRL